ncbi:MAG: DUF58 domain-containing protein [Planctomycetes bacterium]|nr:DUF58 domain-containing protein [Planctomycetota bacterium]MBM4087889.1 DUF58 domain-containing protein [Planctomycetota bacterium]
MRREIQREIEGSAHACRLRMPERQRLHMAGDVAGKRTGSSIEYQDRKDYVPGDDLRHVDWRAFARTDRLTVKLYREEISPHLDIIVDTSRSMGVSPEKGERAAQLAYFFHLLARQFHASTRVHNLGASLVPVHHPFELEQAERIRVKSPFPLLDNAPAARRGGIKVFVSDFLFPFEPRGLARVFRDADHVVLVQLLARFEAQPEPGGNWRLVDAETGEYLHVQLNHDTVKGYGRRLQALQDGIDRQMRILGGGFGIVGDVEPWDQVLRRLFRAGIIEVC